MLPWAVADQLDAPLGDGPRGLRLELRADLVDDDDLGHVVLHRLDHDLVLQRRRPNLHPAGLADGRVRDVAIAGDLVGGVDHDDPLAHFVSQNAGGLAEHGRLADPGPTHDQDRLAALDEVLDDLDRPVDRPPDPARQTDDLAVPIADGADPVEGPLDAGPVVVPERTDVVDHVEDVGFRDLPLEEDHLAVGEAGLRQAPEVEDDLDEIGRVRQGMDGRHDVRRQRGQEDVEVVDRFAAVVGCVHFYPHPMAGTRAGSATRTRVSLSRSVTVATVANSASSKARSTGAS